jgi:hypothetical protein
MERAAERAHGFSVEDRHGARDGGGLDARHDAKVSNRLAGELPPRRSIAILIGRQCDAETQDPVDVEADVNLMSLLYRLHDEAGDHQQRQRQSHL